MRFEKFQTPSTPNRKKRMSRKQRGAEFRDEQVDVEDAEEDRLADEAAWRRIAQVHANHHAATHLTRHEAAAQQERRSKAVLLSKTSNMESLHHRLTPGERELVKKCLEKHAFSVEIDVVAEGDPGNSMYEPRRWLMWEAQQKKHSQKGFVAFFFLLLSLRYGTFEFTPSSVRLAQA